MPIRYRSAAIRIVRGCAQAQDGGELTELLEAHCSEEESAHVLQDDPDKQAQRLERLRDAVVDVIHDYEARRLMPPVRQSDLAPTFFIFAFVDVADDPEMTDLHARLRLQPDLERLLQEVDDQRFESLCGRLLERIGCVGVTVTQQNQDSGVDFVARLPIVSGVDDPNPGIAAFVRVVGQIAFILYGQAKRYGPANPVDGDTVHKLVGSWKDRRNEFADGTIQPAARAAMLRAGYRAANPALLIVATTAGYTRAAIRRAEATGVVLLDGEQISQLMLQLGLGATQADVGWTTDQAVVEAACA